MNKCQCFSCRHHEEPRLLKSYFVGYASACEWFLNWAQRNNIKMGSIGDEKDDISTIYAEIKCNYDDTKSLMSELPDIEDGFNVELEYQNAQDKISGLEAELEETLRVLYNASEEKRDWIKINFPNIYERLK